MCQQPSHKDSTETFRSDIICEHCRYDPLNGLTPGRRDRGSPLYHHTQQRGEHVPAECFDRGQCAGTVQDPLDAIRHPLQDWWLRQSSHLGSASFVGSGHSHGDAQEGEAREAEDVVNVQCRAEGEHGVQVDMRGDGICTSSFVM